MNQLACLKARDMLRSDATVGDIIRNRLYLKSMKQNKLAHYIGMSPGKLSSVLSGRKPLTPYIALRIERALKNVYAEELLIAQMKTKLNHERERIRNGKPDNQDAK